MPGFLVVRMFLHSPSEPQAFIEASLIYDGLESLKTSASLTDSLETVPPRIKALSPKPETLNPKPNT